MSRRDKKLEMELMKKFKTKHEPRTQKPHSQVTKFHLKRHLHMADFATQTVAYSMKVTEPSKSITFYIKF